MLRFTVTILMFILTVGSVYAGSKSVNESHQAESVSTRYLYTHVISSYYDAKMQANDHLVVSGRNDKEMSFLLTAIANENHECVIEGKAIRSADGRYNYQENMCRMIFTFGSDEVVVQVTGTNGNYCQCPDLRSGHGCGYNTRIDSATYKKAKKKPQAGSFSVTPGKDGL